MPALSRSTIPQTFPPFGAIKAPLIIIVTTLPTTLSKLPTFLETLGCNALLSTIPSNHPQISWCCFCGVYCPCAPVPVRPLPSCICFNVHGDQAMTGVRCVSEGAGMTSVGQPFSMWIRSWPQPGRREVDHIPLPSPRKGDIPIKVTSRRAWGKRAEGEGSHRGITDADSVRSLWVRWVSAARNECQQHLAGDARSLGIRWGLETYRWGMVWRTAPSRSPQIVWWRVSASWRIGRGRTILSHMPCCWMRDRNRACVYRLQRP